MRANNNDHGLEFMLDLISKHPSILHANEISEICKPLEKLNISYFAHVKISNDKKFSAISSHPIFTEHYLKNKFYTADIHMVDEKRFGNFFVWDGIEFSGESARMCREAGEIGIHHPFTIIDRTEEGIEYFHFASNSTNRQVNQAYIANFDLLKMFIAYFKENVNQSKALSKAYAFKIDVGAVPNTSFEDETIIYDRSEFLQNIHPVRKDNRILIDNVKLSVRQSEIMRHVVRGKTMKEISKIMNLSPRTVGHYFETIKNKLNVGSRSELISKTIELDRLEIFHS